MELKTRNEHDTANAFHYDPLSAPNSLRLLKVLPEKLNGRFQIQLWETTETVSYRCLSYMWGDQTERFLMFVNGQEMGIGESLYTFLEVAQHRLPDENLWIDALCINQGDDQEKSLQVQRMGSIFATATEVLVWLGNDHLLAELFDWASKPRNSVDKALPLERTPKHLKTAILDFCNHPYWDRAWITQELLLSQSFQLLCGFSQTTHDALSICANPLRRIVDRDALRESVRFDDIMEMLQNFSTWTIPVTFARLIVHRGNTQCRDLRDKLYSLLAITGHESNFKVDYSESLVDLYVRSLYYFSAWMNLMHTVTLWNLLELDREILTAHVQDEKAKGNSKPVQLTMAMRRSKIRETLRRQVPNALIGRRVGECANDNYGFSRCQITRFSASRDMLLCPKTDMADVDQFNVHLLIRPSPPRSSSPFLLYMLTHDFGRMLCPPDTEIWHTDNIVETRVESWADLARLAGPAGAEEVDWKTRPHFLIKLSHQYIINAVEHYTAAFEKHRWQRKS